jgi:hypothetical protein
MVEELNLDYHEEQKIAKQIELEICKECINWLNLL